MTAVGHAFRWVLAEAWEKINVVATWHELRTLGRKHGWRFFAVALLWELIEDVLFPYLSWRAGVPALIPFFLVMHFEPVVYPIFFWAFRTYDRLRGREPWEPKRGVYSSHWRSAGKVAVYKVAASGWYAAILMGLGYSPRVMVVYVALISAFGFVHERIWHDSGYGIGDNGRGDPDHVFPRRILAKTTTYTIVSTTILASLFQVSFGSIPWGVLLACQGAGIVLYVVFEFVWARSKWGVARISKPTLIAEG